VSPMTGSVKSMVIGQVKFDVNKAFAVSLLDRSLPGSPGILYFCARSSKIALLYVTLVKKTSITVATMTKRVVHWLHFQFFPVTTKAPINGLSPY
jgi:hypothetical protein